MTSNMNDKMVIMATEGRAITPFDCGRPASTPSLVHLPAVADRENLG